MWSEVSGLYEGLSCPFDSMLYGLLPKFPFAHWKEFWTILEFASLQIALRRYFVTKTRPAGSDTGFAAVSLHQEWLAKIL